MKISQNISGNKSLHQLWIYNCHCTLFIEEEICYKKERIKLSTIRPNKVLFPLPASKKVLRTQSDILSFSYLQHPQKMI